MNSEACTEMKGTYETIFSKTEKYKFQKVETVTRPKNADVPNTKDEKELNADHAGYLSTC